MHLHGTVYAFAGWASGLKAIDDGQEVQPFNGVMLSCNQVCELLIACENFKIETAKNYFEHSRIQV